MGIHNLNKFLIKNCPEVFEEIHISEFAFKKVAIDISLYMCKFKIVCGDAWLTSFVNLVTCLRKNEIHCVFIYDSGSPPEKANEKAERADKRNKIEDKIFILEESLDHYYKTNEIDQVLLDFHNKKQVMDVHKDLLTNKPTFNIDLVEREIKKMKSYILNITPADFELTKKLFDILRIPYFMAPLEAETMCSDLCKRGLVDAVISEDTDVIAYGAPLFLTKINIFSDTCVKICYEKVLESLKLTSDQMLDLCILCGTDYNKNIYKVGPEKAYKYILNDGSIDNIKNVDISVLNHKRVREIFKDYKIIDDIDVMYCGQPDFDKLKLFIETNNIRIDMDTILNAFTHNIVIFDE